ncbi:MAG: transposase, partial [Cytophagaceae bacterium]|nr:transposase [Cytophagaceae bacterium]
MDFFQGTDAEVKTDKWAGYLPLAAKGWNIEQEKSKGGKNFELIHRFIMGLKGWVRGIYHKISQKYAQGYLD